MRLFRYANFVVLVICCIFCDLSNGGCPNPHRLHPCTCLKSRSVLTCEDLFNEEHFKTITEISRGHGIVGVEFESVAMRFIPEDAFEGLDIKVSSFLNSILGHCPDVLILGHSVQLLLLSVPVTFS